MRRKLPVNDILSYFKDRKIITSKELLAFWRTQQPDLKETTFRWRLYELKHRGFLSTVGRGKYSLNEQRKFAPDVSVGGIKPLANKLKKTLPYLKFCFWTTQWLHDFMIHQPSTAVVLLEVEEEAENSTFSFLQDRDRFALIEPSPIEIERYILGSTAHPIVLRPLIHDSPLTEESGVPIPKLEKILVDLYVEKELFLPFQGKELANIYRNAFSVLNLNTTTLLAYAARRGKKAAILEFLRTSTGIDLNDKQQIAY